MRIAMPIVVRDELPRLITYPIGEIFLRTHLASSVREDDAGLYYLYLSGVQVNLYDPVTSRATAYPVLALDRQPPQLCNDALARLEEQQRKRERAVDERRAGVLRADAQLRGQDSIGAPAAPFDQQAAQRPLVICFDEDTGRVSAKFAEPRDDAKERHYR